MKDICTAYSDGYNITLCDSEGNSIVTPLNIDCYIKDVQYECGSLIFTDQRGQETRICTDFLVEDGLNRVVDYYRNDHTGTSIEPPPLSNSTNTVLAQIIAKVLGEFLQTPDGVRAIEKELNNYFNGIS